MQNAQCESGAAAPSTIFYVLHFATSGTILHVTRISERRPSRPQLCLRRRDKRCLPVKLFGLEFFGERSLFFMLSRAPWWLSLLIAAGLFMLVRLFMPNYAALASTMPFLGIAAYSALRQSRVLSPQQADDALAGLRTLSWQEFALRMEAAFRSEGYAVVRLNRGAADFRLTKGGRTALASCRRWKVAQTGVEALRELSLAKDEADAAECIYVAAGDLSPNARQFAAQNKIRLLCAAELAQYLAQTARDKSRQRQ